MPDPQDEGLGGRAADRLDEFRRARGLDDDDDRVVDDTPAEGDERPSDDAPAEGDERPADDEPAPDDEGAARDDEGAAHDDDDTEGVHRPD